MTGYSMQTARKIMGCSVAYAIIDNPEHTDYPAILELYRTYISGERSAIYLIFGAFSLGRAVGIRDERAKHRGETVSPLPKAFIDEAEAEVEKARTARRLAEAIQKLDPSSKTEFLNFLQALEKRD